MNKEIILKQADLEKTLFIKGVSMYPFLRTGDLVTFEETNIKNLRNGDILIFRPKDSGANVVHRLINIDFTDDNYRLLTKGDNNNDYDTVFASQQLIGKAKTVLRGSKTIRLSGFSQKLKNNLLLFLSKNNLNIFSFKNYSFTKFALNSPFFIKTYALFLNKNVFIKIFQLPDGTKILKAFSGKKDFFHAVFEKHENQLNLKRWFLRYPYYKTEHGGKLVEELINLAKDSGLDRINCLPVKKDDRFYILFEKFTKGAGCRLNGSELTVNIKEIR